MEEIKVKALAPAKTPDATITIPVAEYMYLQRVDALMDVLLTDSSYNSANTIQAVKMAAMAMRNGDTVGVDV